METNESNNLEINEAFSLIASLNELSSIGSQIAYRLKDGLPDRRGIGQILDRNNIPRIEDVKQECLDLLILYINLILNDHTITDKEFMNVKQLKLLFNIREGDFVKYRYEEVKDITYRQLEGIYRDDNRIDDKEAIHKTNLQGLFDLSYDQFLNLMDREIRIALEKGGDIRDLDTARFPNSIRHNEEVGGLNLIQEIQDIVLERDGGICMVCKSNRDIRFYPIIPLRNGGSATYRNVRLLCANCARL